MTRHFYLFTSLSAAMLVGNVAGCADDSGDVSVAILNNMKPAADDGLVTASETGPFSSPGHLNLATAGQFTMIPLMKNFASSNQSAQTISRTFFGESFLVSLSSPDPAIDALIKVRDFSELDGFSIAPDGSLTVAFVTVISRDLRNAIAANWTANSPTAVIVAKVQAVGKMGGSTMSSNEFSFPIEIDCVDPITDPPTPGVCPK